MFIEKRIFLTFSLQISHFLAFLSVDIIPLGECNNETFFQNNGLSSLPGLSSEAAHSNRGAEPKSKGWVKLVQDQSTGIDQHI